MNQSSFHHLKLHSPIYRTEHPFAIAGGGNLDSERVIFRVQTYYLPEEAEASTTGWYHPRPKRPEIIVVPPRFSNPFESKVNLPSVIALSSPGSSKLSRGGQFAAGVADR